MLKQHGLEDLVSRDAIDKLDSELNAEEEEEELFTQKAVDTIEVERFVPLQPLGKKGGQTGIPQPKPRSVLITGAAVGVEPAPVAVKPSASSLSNWAAGVWDGPTVCARVECSCMRRSQRRLPSVHGSCKISASVTGIRCFVER